MIAFRNMMTNRLPKLCFHDQLLPMSRWSGRIPRKVHLPEVENENIPLVENNDHVQENYPTKFSFKEKGSERLINRSNHEVLTLRKAKKKKENSTTDMLETVINADGDLVYTKMNENDSRVAMILSNLKSEKNLKKQESILLEGKRLIREALRSDCKLKYILFSRKSDLEELKVDLPKTGAQIYKMPYREMQMWSDLTTNPGIMGVFKTPNIKEVQEHAIPVNIICDNVREPGNLGAILRTCAGVGCKQVILTKGCCDLWNNKVLRSAMGAHFKLSIQKLDWEEIKNNLDGTNWFIADNNVVNTSDKSSLIVDLVNKIPIESYDALNYSGANEISLIIGGETEGISHEAYFLVESLGGMRINIPLGNNIDSLNSGTALGVLMFEMRRQIKAMT